MLFDFIQTAFFFMGVPFGQAATGFAALPCSTALRTKPSASFTRHCATILNYLFTIARILRVEFHFALWHHKKMPEAFC
jgi:hypothetical protein